MATVELENISKGFSDHQVIRDLSLHIDEGEFVTLLGPSGCGKTTLLRMIAGLETIDCGTLKIGGKHYNAVPAQNRPIAMVFQSYALFPHMTVRDNILFGLKIRRMGRGPMEEKLNWVVPMLGLSGLEKRLPRQISGGQRQRVALARSLVLDPEVLLLDEPLSNLDAALRDLATEELKRIHRRVGKTIIYVTHNQVEAMTMSGRIAVLNAGNLEQYDTPRVVYDTPRTIFAAEFIGSPSMNFLDGTVTVRDGVAGIQSSLGFLLFDRDRDRAAVALDGKVVRVGIRPQSIAFINHLASRRASDTMFTVTIDLVENLGDRCLVVARRHGGVEVRFMVTRDEDLSINESRTVFVDGRKIHVFDPQTGERLL